jgi:peptidoglycan/xylan/chitin deacetylase (PgdA/CDA1 family)
MPKIFKLLKATFKTVIIVSLLLVVVVAAGYFYARANFYDIPVLMYHNVSPAAEGNTANVTPERFKQQMSFIKSNNYKVITPLEYSQILKEGKSKSAKNLVMLTFDDGYENNYTYAYPVLKENGFTAVIFVVVNKIGQEGYLTIDEIKEMQKSGIVIASHTLNEKYVPSLKKVRLTEELCGSKEKLQQLTGKPVEFFAYCSGGYTIQAQKILKDAGYLLAFTTNRGFDKSLANDDPYAIRRIKVTDKDYSFKLWAKLSGIYNIFHTIRDPY